MFSSFRAFVFRIRRFVLGLHELREYAVFLKLLAEKLKDPEGANTPGDSDSLATLAGALTGARCGLDALPAAWIRGVEGSRKLLELARRAAEGAC